MRLGLQLNEAYRASEMTVCLASKLSYKAKYAEDACHVCMPVTYKVMMHEGIYTTNCERSGLIYLVFRMC